MELARLRVRSARLHEECVQCLQLAKDVRRTSIQGATASAEDLISQGCARTPTQHVRRGARASIRLAATSNTNQARKFTTLSVEQ